MGKLINIVDEYKEEMPDGMYKKLVEQMHVIHKINNNKKIPRNTNRNNRERNNRTRNPSGFNRPCPISRELADFLNVPSHQLMARTEATKLIHKYIKDHRLQNPRDGREINPDTLLQRLLKIPDGVQLSYFNLQTYLSPHFRRV